MKTSIIFLIGFFSFYTSMAQVEEEQMEQGMPNSQQNRTNSIYGKLVDKNTGKPIEAASVQLYPASKKKTSMI